MHNVYGDPYISYIKRDVRHKVQAEFKDVKAMEYYTELQRPEEPSGHVLIERITIDVSGGWTCPSKVLAIFAHNEDIDYREIFKGDSANAI